LDTRVAFTLTTELDFSEKIDLSLDSKTSSLS